MTNAEQLIDALLSIYKLPQLKCFTSEYGFAGSVVLHYLDKNQNDDSAVKALSISELSEKLNISRSAVSQIIDKLEKADMVERVQGVGANRKNVFVRLSDKGVSSSEKRKTLVEQYFNNVVNYMGMYSIDVLVSLLNEFLSILIKVSDI